MGQITNRNSDDSSSDYNAANSNTLASPSPSKASKEDSVVPARLPRSVQAIYLKPLRREPQFGVPSCDLQMRSYSVRNLEFFADFALRAAYYLKLPAFGPVPLPRITERWTVPRSNFIFKKSQENFERITKRRLIQIKDGHPETVGLWLAFLKKHAYYGVGMKANIWDYDELGVGKTMDVSVQNLENILEPKWTHFGRKRNLKTSEKVMDLMNTEKFKLASGHNQPMTWASLSEN
ncbi:MAG: mitochondrial 37S ribosomal protein rsm10 [Claussenomyces sp. TS43310]|nr:MAG: mitochondrial 37S ribosomal protein rsm10 [Claussenomyces sp. TS43310]